MAPKIFLTGATGYIGGSVLDAIVTSHPEYDITVLLRSVPPSFSSRYPNVKIVKGHYDSFDIIADATSQASVVVHNGNSDHEPSLNAIITGLLRRSTPSFLIHLSGTGIVSDFRNSTYLGALNPKVWSDITDLDTIFSLPDNALHRNTEKLIQAAVAQDGDRLKAAIMCPPDIYGEGRGPLRSKSVFVPWFVDESKKQDGGGRTFYTGDGGNTRSWVHIDDLMMLYLKVVEAAVAGGTGADWGKEGYYFAGTQEVSQRDIAIAAGKILKKLGIIKNEEPFHASLDQIDTMCAERNYPGIARYLFASNSRTEAERAKKLFGYKPKAPTLLETLEDDILSAVGEK
ncbi:NAD(P)-binding protein [Lindgomyces ingoldianus]|uniref:NAD(P)-binding protein n=1 Tax=Lindgomyces ingoldianus TaxID=673940 RepID=A0ACB6R864_9PLEO|nr:NAD(P)-binding protein [Lindgomyces ingoldianus]KAF2475454.1 NAD(P)-binding protein [Lindgomyces ingoldianus]